METVIGMRVDMMLSWNGNNKRNENGDGSKFQRDKRDQS